MNSLKSNICDSVKKQLAQSISHRIISRKLFLFDFTAAFKDNPDKGFSILNAIKDFFDIPFSSIKIAGSAQIGHSFHQAKDFTPGESDLDVAIISDSLFKRYCEIAYRFTDGYSNYTRFPKIEGLNTVTTFKDYLCKGFFRPDLMPNCPDKDTLFRFFNRLTSKHTDLFKSISCGIYFSEDFFEFKQEPIVSLIQKGGQNDKV